MTEAELQSQVAVYLRMKYPNVIFHSDFGSGVRLRPHQARMQKIQNGGRRAWPDMFIAQPMEIDKGQISWRSYAGLFIELKREGTRLKKKNGEWASEHIAEQAHMLSELTARGYKADFAIGFDQAVRLIDDYLESGKEDTNQWF